MKTLPSSRRMIVFSVAGLLAAGIIFWSFANILFPPQPGHPAAYSHTTHTATAQANTLVSPLLFGTNIGLFNNNDQVLTSAPTRNLLEQIHTRIIRMPVRTNLSEATEIQAAHDIKQLGAVA